jgi:ribosomal protein L9
MKVILKQEVKNLGEKDELVTVKNGYGSNFLIPKGMAILATESNQKQLAETMKQRAFKIEKQKKEAQKVIDFLKDVTIKVGAKAGENGKIFGSVTSIQIADAINFDYTKIVYDTVFTSPPYYSIEKYPNSNKYDSKKEMEEKFYKPLFTNAYNGLQIGGYYIINICKEIYNKVLKELLGEAYEIFPLKKSQRQNNYTEMVYVWVKK